MELNALTAHELLKMLKKKSITPKDILLSILKRIDAVEKKIKALANFDRKVIEKRLEEIEGSENNGALFGIPVLIKDNISVKDELTTCSSKILKGYKPSYDATIIKNLKRDGAILLGKANMDEFAFGSSCETSCYGPTHNPWDIERIPGGSSGGSAAAIAGDTAILALGSDTGGSIRQPASLCGVVGFKPTYGRVSRFGLIAFASSLDQIGPITKDVEDSALLLNSLASFDTNDSTSVNIKIPDYTRSLIDDVKGIRIGIPKEYFVEGIEAEVKSAVLKAIDLFKKLGAKVSEVSLPCTEYAVSCYYIIAPAEASSNLARFDGVQYGLRANSDNLLDMYEKTRSDGFGPEAKRRIVLGTYSLSSGYYEAYYLKAMKVRTKIKEDFDNAFKEVDCILTPTSPTTAFKIGEKLDDPLSMYLSDIFTIPANLAGIPGISIPCGFTKKNLPVGMQILANSFMEEMLFRVAYTFEKNTEFHKRKPNI